MPYRTREFPHAIMQRAPISQYCRYKAHCVRFVAKAIFLVVNLPKEKIGKLYTRDHPESSIGKTMVQLTARKADGGTSCYCVASEPSFLALFRLVQSSSVPNNFRANQCPYRRAALPPCPATIASYCTLSLACRSKRCRNRWIDKFTARQSDSNFPALLRHLVD